MAERIGDAPELEEMTSLYSQWGVEPKDAGRGGGQAPDSGHRGFLNETEMEILESASGTRFDRLFLERMIDHHRGAVLAAHDEMAQGESDEAKRLAGDIIEMRTPQIGEMGRLLADIGA